MHAEQDQCRLEKGAVRGLRLFPLVRCAVPLARCACCSAGPAGAPTPTYRTGSWRLSSSQSRRPAAGGVGAGGQQQPLLSNLAWQASCRCRGACYGGRCHRTGGGLRRVCSMCCALFQPEPWLSESSPWLRHHCRTPSCTTAAAPPPSPALRRYAGEQYWQQMLDLI